MIWYFADLSELRADPKQTKADIFVTAGFAINTDCLLQLAQAISKVKENRTGYSSYPVKWNMKDIGRARDIHGKGLTNSREFWDLLREEVLQELFQQQPTIFISILGAHSTKQSISRERHQQLVQYSFGNLLQRFALNKQTDVDKPAVVTMDWPESNDRTPFIREYLSAWRDGQSHSRHLYTNPPPYYSGPLRALGFLSSIHFAATDIDVYLQATDLIVGATRQFVETAIRQKGEENFGSKCFRQLILPLVARDPKNQSPLGYGIAISPKDSPLAQQIREALEKIDVHRS